VVLHFFGEVYSISDVLGGYRVHDSNNWFRSDRRKSQEFLCLLQDYLNRKLIEHNLSPVISFDESILRLVWASGPTGGGEDWGWRMLKLSVQRHDRYTAVFVYHTLMTIGMHVMKALRSRTRGGFEGHLKSSSALNWVNKAGQS